MEKTVMRTAGTEFPEVRAVVDRREVFDWLCGQLQEGKVKEKLWELYLEECCKVRKRDSRRKTGSHQNGAGIVPEKEKSEEAKRRPGGGGGKMQLRILGKNFAIVKNCFTAEETLALIGRFVRDSTVLVKVEIEGGEEERGGAEDSVDAVL